LDLLDKISVMSKKWRFIVYACVGLPIPIASYFMFPELGFWEPVSFVLLVMTLATVYEVRLAAKKRK
jgi:hypothetical protein